MGSSQHDTDHCRVLIVESEPDIQKLVATVLQEDGFEVVAVGTAAEACQAIEREKFQLALVDVTTAGDASEFADHIWRNSSIGVLLVSSRHELEDRLRTCGHGFLLKPFGLGTLLDAVHEVMRASHAAPRNQDHSDRPGASGRSWSGTPVGWIE